MLVSVVLEFHSDPHSESMICQNYTNRSPLRGLKTLLELPFATNRSPLRGSGIFMVLIMLQTSRCYAAHTLV